MASVTSQEPTPGDRPGVVGRTRNGTVTYQASPVMPSPTASSQPGSSSSSPWSSTAPAQRPSNETRTSTATLIPEDLDGLRIVTTPTKAKYSSDAGYSARSSTSRKGKERDDGTFDEGNDGDDWAPSQGPAFVSSSTRDSEPGRKAKGTLGIGAVNLRSSKSARIKWSVLHGDGEDIGRADGMDDDEDDEQGRMGLVGSSGRGNGGRQKIMDLEQGYGAGSSAGGSADAGAYPPLSEEELEEKRIQENLARFAAKDAARRRAARASKMYGPPASAAASPNGGGFSAGGLGRKPTMGQKRASLFGFLGLGGGYEQAKRDSQLSNGSPRIVSPVSRPTSVNPFESGESPTNTSFLTPSPTRETQPGIELRPTPIMRGAELAPEDADVGGRGDLHRSSSHASLIEAPGGVVFEPSRRPRAERYESQRMETRPPPPQEGFSHHTEAQKKDHWWSALCAWGDDLDEGGVDGQAGRTNPME